MGFIGAFVGCDCSMVEINPLVVTKKGDVLALDAKFNFDKRALSAFRRSRRCEMLRRKIRAKSKRRNMN